jgi:hypothetical protein
VQRRPFNPAAGPADENVMNTERLLAYGEQGVHLLFDTRLIHEALRQDPQRLRQVVERRFDEVHGTVQALLALQNADAGRQYVAGLPSELQHVLVLLYFELLDDRLRKRETRH